MSFNSVNGHKHDFDHKREEYGCALEHVVEEQEEIINQLKAHLEAQNAQIKTYRDKLDELISNKQSLSDKGLGKTCQTNVDSLVQQIAQAKIEIAKYKDKIVDLDNQIATATVTNLGLKNDNTSLTSQLNAANQNISSLQAQLAGCQNGPHNQNAQITALQAQIVVLQNQIAQNTTYITDLQKQLQKANSDNHDLEISNEGLKAQITRLTTENNDLKSKLGKTCPSIQEVKENTNIGNSLLIAICCGIVLLIIMFGVYIYFANPSKKLHG